MPLNPLHGFARGLSVGLAGGLLAGLIEAISLVRDAPTGRAALMEAGLYAVIVDALTCAAIAAVVGTLFALVLRVARSQLKPDRVAAYTIKIKEMEKALIDFYARRNPDRRDVMTMKAINYL